MKSFRSKPVGWRGESHRHYLAAKYGSAGAKVRYFENSKDWYKERLETAENEEQREEARRERQEKQDKYDQMIEEWEEEEKYREYGLEPLGENAMIDSEENGYALVRFHDPDSPASEHPDVYKIIQKGGKEVWSSGITQMGEYAFQGIGPEEVGLRADAKKKLKEIAGGKK